MATSLWKFGFNFEILHEIQILFLCFYLFARGCNYINRKLHDVPLKVGLKILNQNLYLLLFLSKKWFDKKYLILFLLANHFLHLCSNINVKIFLKIGVEYYSIKQMKIPQKMCKFSLILKILFLQVPQRKKKNWKIFIGN